MKLEVGMYVRTNKYGVGKVTKVDGGRFTLKVNKKHYIPFDTEVIKASHSLLGNDKEPSLIGRGDYVNGEEVFGLYELDGKRYADVDRVCYSEEEIETIVTKEQFAAMQYEVK